MTAHAYIDTAADGTGDGTTRSHTTATGAYASMASWESSEQTTLTENHIVRCAGSTDDTTVVSISGWTPGIYTISILGDKGEDDTSAGGDDGTAFDDDGFYDGNFSHGSSHYELTQSGGFVTLSVGEENVVIDGIQIYCGKASSGAVAAEVGYTDTIINNCRVGIRVSGGSFRSTTSEISNNIVYDGGVSGIRLARAASAADATTNVYNNIVYDGTTGIEITSDNAGDTWNVKNNVVFNCTNEYVGLNLDVNSTINSTHNAGEGSAPTGHNSNWITLSTTLTDDLTDPENAGGPTSDDLRPVSAGGIDNEGIGSGTDGNAPTTDILGNSRSTSAPSLGAFEVVAAAGFTPKGVFNKPFYGPFGGPLQ